jgi:hypothetical protein
MCESASAPEDGATMIGFELPLSNGYITVIDAEDLPRICSYHWHARYCKPDRYAARTTSRRIVGVRKVVAIYLHRFLLDAPPELQVDHINGDTLDNRKANLELVSPEENLARRHWKRD